MTLNEIVMEINEVNKKLYEDAFIADGEYGYLNDWKPSIDEREITESCEDENGNWIPATPIGYRDYKISRQKGLENILLSPGVKRFTKEEIHNIRREDNVVKQYDKIVIDNADYSRAYVVVGDDETKFYVTDDENQLYCVSYKE